MHRGTTPSLLVVVGSPLYISLYFYKGPSAVEATVVEEEGGSNGGIVANISGIWKRGCGAHWRPLDSHQPLSGLLLNSTTT